MATIIRVSNRDAVLWVNGLLTFTELTLRTAENERSLYILRLTDNGFRLFLRQLHYELSKAPVDTVVWFAHTPIVFKWSWRYAQLSGYKDNVDSQRFLAYRLDKRITNIAQTLTTKHESKRYGSIKNNRVGNQ